MFRVLLKGNSVRKLPDSASTRFGQIIFGAGWMLTRSALAGIDGWATVFLGYPKYKQI